MKRRFLVSLLTIFVGSYAQQEIKERQERIAQLREKRKEFFEKREQEKSEAPKKEPLLVLKEKEIAPKIEIKKIPLKEKISALRVLQTQAIQESKEQSKNNSPKNNVRKNIDKRVQVHFEKQKEAARVALKKEMKVHESKNNLATIKKNTIKSQDSEQSLDAWQQAWNILIKNAITDTEKETVLNIIDQMTPEQILKTGSWNGIENGKKVTTTGVTLLMLATGYAGTPAREPILQPEIVQKLIKKNPKIVSIADSDDMTPLYCLLNQLNPSERYVKACNLIVSLLLNYMTLQEYAVEIRNNTALSLACQNGLTDAVKMMLNKFGDATFDIIFNKKPDNYPGTSIPQGWNYLTIALANGHYDVAELLVNVDKNNTLMNIVTNSQTPLTLVIGCKYSFQLESLALKLLQKITKEQYEVQDGNGYTPLLIALIDNYTQVAKAMIQKFGDTTFDVCAVPFDNNDLVKGFDKTHGLNPLAQAIIASDMNIVDLLVKTDTHNLLKNGLTLDNIKMLQKVWNQDLSYLMLFNILIYKLGIQALDYWDWFNCKWSGDSVVIDVTGQELTISNILSVWTDRKSKHLWTEEQIEIFIDLIPVASFGTYFDDPIYNTKTTIFLNALAQGHWDLARLLIEKVSSSILLQPLTFLKDSYVVTPLEIAIQKNNKEIVEQLLKKIPAKDIFKNTTLEDILNNLETIKKPADQVAMLTLLLKYIDPDLFGVYYNEEDARYKMNNLFYLVGLSNQDLAPLVIEKVNLKILMKPVVSLTNSKVQASLLAIAIQKNNIPSVKMILQRIPAKDILANITITNLINQINYIQKSVDRDAMLQLLLSYMDYKDVAAYVDIYNDNNGTIFMSQFPLLAGVATTHVKTNDISKIYSDNETLLFKVLNQFGDNSVYDSLVITYLSDLFRNLSNKDLCKVFAGKIYLDVLSWLNVDSSSQAAFNKFMVTIITRMDDTAFQNICEQVLKDPQDINPTTWQPEVFFSLDSSSPVFQALCQKIANFPDKTIGQQFLASQDITSKVVKTKDGKNTIVYSI